MENPVSCNEKDGCRACSDVPVPSFRGVVTPLPKPVHSFLVLFIWIDLCTYS